MKRKLNRSSGMSASRSQDCLHTGQKQADASIHGAKSWPVLDLHSKQPYGNQPSGGALSRLQDTLCMAEQITLLLVRVCASC